MRTSSSAGGGAVGPAGTLPEPYTKIAFLAGEAEQFLHARGDRMSPPHFSPPVAGAGGR